MKKMIAVLLMVCMLIGLLPVVAFADGAPVIVDQPQDATIVNGEDAIYTIYAEGENLSYQWYYYYAEDDMDPLSEGIYFSGTQTNTLTVPSVMGLSLSDYDCEYNGDMYCCVVSNENGEVRSNIVYYYVSDHVYGADQSEHWFECECYDDVGAHEDADEDGVCEVCDTLFAYPFIDVKDPAVWYYEAAEYGRWANYFKGDLNGMFNGDSAITRAEAATVIARSFARLDQHLDLLDEEEFLEFLGRCRTMIGEDETDIVTFSDVAGTWYERYALALANLGIINGYEDGTFKGDNLITRQEIAALLYRFSDLLSDTIPSYGDPVDGYNDAEDVAEWAVPYVEWCAETGLFQGDSDQNFNPQKNATRAEFAQLMLRFDNGREYEII